MEKIRGENMFPVYDLHFHIIPEIDDGARNMEESLLMIKSAVNQGVTDVFCTSHSMFFNKGGKNYKEGFKKLSEIIRLHNIPVRLHEGCEINCQLKNIDSIIQRVDDGWYDTLGSTKYVLVEFNPDVEISEALGIVKAFAESGYVPVIAHMERNYNLRLSSVKLLMKEGALIQVNAYSFVKESNKEMCETARSLLKNKSVHFIGSDAHRVDERLPELTSGVNYVMDNVDKLYAEEILYGNAKRIISETF